MSVGEMGVRSAPRWKPETRLLTFDLGDLSILTDFWSVLIITDFYC